MRCAEPQFDVINLKIRLNEFFQYPFQVRHGNVFVDGQTFDLMEHRRVGLVVIGAIHTTWANHAHRGACFFHGADLHGAGVGSQNVRRAIVTIRAVHVKRVHFGACGVVRRNVQRVKVIPIAVNARPFGDAKAHVGKNGCDLFGHLADWVNGALARGARGQCHVQPFRPQTFVQSRIGKRGFFRRQRAVDFVFQRV